MIFELFRDFLHDLRAHRTRATLTLVAITWGTIAVVLLLSFGQGLGTLAALSLVACIGGFFTNGATAGLYAVIAQSYPASLRGGGTGLVIGIGRAGAALGPILAGTLFEAHWPLSEVAAIMGCGTLIGGIAIAMLRYRESEIA